MSCVTASTCPTKRKRKAWTARKWRDASSRRCACLDPRAGNPVARGPRGENVGRRWAGPRRRPGHDESTEDRTMSPSRAPEDLEEHLTIEELRDTWSLLSQEDRLLAFKMAPYEDAEDFFLSLSARD